MKKTKIDTAYHGVKFLGKVSYPYGYQKPSKQVIIRVIKKAEKLNAVNEENVLAKVNSQIGSLKNYSCRKLILNYATIITNKNENNVIKYDEEEVKFMYKSD